MNAIFLSYRRNDSAGYAGRLYDDLGRRLGRSEVFRDIDDLEPGYDFVAAIHEGLAECRVFLTLIGREWIDAREASGERRLARGDDYVRIEVADALARNDVRVIPVFVEGATMPAADQLPEDLRELTRLQGISLRDDTWDSDVDRLVAAILKSLGHAAPPSSAARADTSPARSNRGLVLTLAAALGALLIAGFFVFTNDRAPAAADDRPSDSTAPVAETAPAIVTAHPIALPRIVETVHDSIVYTVLSGSIAPHGSTSTLALRIRGSNDGRYPANFWDESFRLEIAGSTLTPTSGLNAILDGHSLKQEVVTFEVPPAVRSATLVITQGNKPGAIALDLTPLAGPAMTATPDTSDALSRAISMRLIPGPRPLGKVGGVEYTVAAAVARRFANATRVMASVRLTNRSRDAQVLTVDAFRLAVDGEILAPVSGDLESIPHDASGTIDLQFDCPPGVRNAALRLTLDASTFEAAFDNLPR